MFDEWIVPENIHAMVIKDHPLRRTVAVRAAYSPATQSNTLQYIYEHFHGDIRWKVLGAIMEHPNCSNELRVLISLSQ